MKANNQNEVSTRDVFLFIYVATLVFILVLITLALYATNVSTCLASLLYVAASLIFFALVFYIDRKATMYEGGGKDK